MGVLVGETVGFGGSVGTAVLILVGGVVSIAGSSTDVTIGAITSCGNTAAASGATAVGKVANPLPRTSRFCTGSGNRATYRLGISLRIAGNCQKRTADNSRRARVRGSSQRLRTLHSKIHPYFQCQSNTFSSPAVCNFIEVIIGRFRAYTRAIWPITAALKEQVGSGGGVQPG